MLRHSDNSEVMVPMCLPSILWPCVYWRPCTKNPRPAQSFVQTGHEDLALFYCLQLHLGCGIVRIVSDKISLS